MPKTHPMQPFWDRVNAMLAKHDVDSDVVQTDIHGNAYTTKVSKLIVGGYLEIEAHGVTYRSVPVEHTTLWIAWEPYEIVGHFSKLTDPNGTIRWVSFRPGED